MALPPAVQEMAREYNVRGSTANRNRLLGGLGVGASLIVAPMYIAEISPAAVRGRMVSFNQLNIVIGIVGGAIGGWLFSLLGTDPGSGLIGSIVTATIGAVLLLWVAGKLKS